MLEISDFQSRWGGLKQRGTDSPSQVLDLQKAYGLAKTQTTSIILALGPFKQKWTTKHIMASAMMETPNENIGLDSKNGHVEKTDRQTTDGWTDRQQMDGQTVMDGQTDRQIEDRQTDIIQTDRQTSVCKTIREGSHVQLKRGGIDVCVCACVCVCVQGGNQCCFLALLSTEKFHRKRLIIFGLLQRRAHFILQ